LTGDLGGSPLFVTRIGEDQTERLEFPDGMELAPDPVAERQLFDLVNEERTQRGLAAFVWDERLVPVARSHSEEMFKLKSSSHGFTRTSREHLASGIHADRHRRNRRGSVWPDGDAALSHTLVFAT
jgi:hypothetical protein